MEATGSYYEALAAYLSDLGYNVSVVNPASIHAFAKANLARIKTDKVDSKLIAQFAASLKPALWQAPAPHVRQLRELTRRLVDLKDILAQERNRLEHAHTTQATIQAMIAFTQDQIKQLEQAIRDHIDKHPDLKDKADLLNSIPGLGKVTIATLLAEIEFERFARAPKLAAFIGLIPSIHQSGSSINTKGRLSKTGSSDLRRALFMPAVVALQYNCVIKAFYARLLSNGKTKMQAVCACMRKLVCIAFGVIKSKTPFDPNYALHA